jgi:hypothetical protein
MIESEMDLRGTKFLIAIPFLNNWIFDKDKSASTKW